MNPIKKQVGGNHYKGMEYEPAEFGFDVGLVSLGTQIAKYLVRDKDSRIENLEKAYHCLELEQSFALKHDDLGWFDIYLKVDDEPYLDKFFSQFEDGDKLKAVMRQYMKANYPQAKGLLRKYINSKIISVGDVVCKVSGLTFSTGKRTGIVSEIALDERMVKISGGGWIYKGGVKLV